LLLVRQGRSAPEKRPPARPPCTGSLIQYHSKFTKTFLEGPSPCHNHAFLTLAFHAHCNLAPTGLTSPMNPIPPDCASPAHHCRSRPVTSSQTPAHSESCWLVRRGLHVQTPPASSFRAGQDSIPLHSSQYFCGVRERYCMFRACRVAFTGRLAAGFHYPLPRLTSGQ
jgi:hypothetical protein